MIIARGSHYSMYSSEIALVVIIDYKLSLSYVSFNISFNSGTFFHDFRLRMEAHMKRFFGSISIKKFYWVLFHTSRSI